MIERHSGVTVAILANGTLFGLLHFGDHPSDVFLMLPYYIAVSAIYGGLTWLPIPFCRRLCCTAPVTSSGSLDGG